MVKNNACGEENITFAKMRRKEGSQKMAAKRNIFRKKIAAKFKRFELLKLSRKRTALQLNISESSSFS